MRKRLIPVRHPVHDHIGIAGQERTWTELTLDVPELMVLLGMPEGTRLISIGSNAMTGVKITVEESLEA